MLFQHSPQFLDEVEEIAQAGAASLMEHWRSLDPSQISEKATNDLVCAADHASERVILDAIRQRFPDHSVLSEETGWSGARDQGPTWIVDPLDGTTNFIHGLPQFAVSVGVAVGGSVDFGVVVDPLRGDVFRAARGRGAWWNGRRCEVSRRTGLAGALLTTGFPFRAHHLIDIYLAVFKDVLTRCKAIRRPGAAALDLAWTACGIFDGFFEFALSPWDVAAGSLLVKEAGGVITDMDGGSAFLESGDVICGPPGVHCELIELVPTHRPTRPEASDSPH